jgi:hypothetical protein
MLFTDPSARKPSAALHVAEALPPKAPVAMSGEVPFNPLEDVPLKSSA